MEATSARSARVVRLLGLGPRLQGTAATEVLGLCVSVGYAKEFLAIDYTG